MLDPQPGEHVLDLCAGPGIKTTAIAARMARPREVIAVELDPGTGRPARETSARGSALRSVTVIEADATRARPGRRLRSRPRGSALLRPRHARLAPRRPLAQVAGDDRAGGRDPGGHRSAGPSVPCGPAGRSSTRPARSPGARTRTASRRARCGRGGVRRRRRPRRRALRSSPRRTTRASCSCGPTATAPTGFFIARLRRSTLSVEAARARRSSGPPARVAASPGCGRPSFRVASAASTACAATSSSRSARTAASTRRSSG